MKIYTSNIYKYICKGNRWWTYLRYFKPSIERYWMGQLVYVGLVGWSIVFDFRGINNINNFVDSLKYPNVWKILKRFK